ncbi:MAG TPA: protein kinase [Polyangiales bacterium]|nr:protein kinase [Polyangiales bacterium]
MIRCPRCGRRLVDAAPVCAKHGPAAVEELTQQVADSLPPIAAFEELGYRNLRALGRGGYGVVYAAERASDGARAAIKLAPLDRRDAAESLQREAAMLRSVGAPLVPEVYDAGKTERYNYVAMERVALPTLADLLLRFGGPAPLDRFESLAYAILAPLEEIHRRGIVHRDLKPENIFVPDTGDARLIDFGLAQERSATVESLHQTEMSAVGDDAGTAEYMSPEQCDGIVDADNRSDIYSVGTLFYEILSGAPPFWGRAADVREAHRSKRPVPLSLKIACPPELDALIRCCLAKDRAQRFADVAALRRAIQVAMRARLPSLRPQASIPAPPLSQKPAAPAAREKRSMGLIFFESRSGLQAVQAVVTSTGGQIVQTNGAQYVAAFGHDIGDNPARIAMVVAHRLASSKLTQRILVDVATVSVQQRPDGSKRIFSPVLTKTDRFPTVKDPEGVMLTAAAADVLPDLEPQLIEGRTDRFTVLLKQSANELTTLGIGVAPLLGRDDEMARLLASAESAATQARPALATVLGPAGYGRTHIAGVIARELDKSTSGFQLLRLNLQEGASSAGQVLRELLSLLLDISDAPSDPSQAKAELQARLGDVGEGTAAAVAHVIGWLGADHPEVRRILSAPGALRHAIARALGETLRRRAQHKPLALIIDDAHLADDATLDALEYATLPSAGVKLWICATVRPNFLGARPNWGSRAAAAERVTLGPLDAKAACELARRLLLPAEHTPEAVLMRLVERTQGEPRLLVELVRGLKRDGFVRRSARGGAYYLATEELDKLPDLPIVQWNAIREIEALPAQLAGHARLASVLGSNFTVVEIEALLTALERDKLPDDMQLDAGVGVRRLLDSGILVRHKSNALNFRHSLLRDTVYQMLPDAERKRLHRAAFEAYRTLSLPDEVRLPRLALHAAQCGERAVAAETYLELARGYSRVQAYLEAEAAYTYALDNFAENDERVMEAARGRGLMRSRLGRQEPALVDLRRARELAHTAGEVERELELMLDEATVLDWMREGNQSRELTQTVAESQHVLSPLLKARLTMSIARAHNRRGESEASISVGQEAVRLAEALGDEGYETRIIALLMLGTDFAYSGKLEPAQRCFEQVIREAGSRGDTWHVAAAHCNRAPLWHGLRDVERLRADLSRTVQLSREIGEASIEWVAVYNLGESEYVIARIDAARECARRALELAKQLFGDSNRETSVSELLLARIALYSDELAAAREHVNNIRERTARGLAAGERDAELEPGQLTMMQMVELGLGDAGDEAWQSLIEKMRSLEMQAAEEVEILERAALAALHAGEFERGRKLYDQARAICEQKPNLMSDRVESRLGPMLAPAS